MASTSSSGTGVSCAFTQNRFSSKSLIFTSATALGAHGSGVSLEALASPRSCWFILMSSASADVLIRGTVSIANRNNIQMTNIGVFSEELTKRLRLFSSAADIADLHFGPSLGFPASYWAWRSTFVFTASEPLEAFESTPLCITTLYLSRRCFASFTSKKVSEQSKRLIATIEPSIGVQSLRSPVVQVLRWTSKCCPASSLCKEAYVWPLSS